MRLLQPPMGRRHWWAPTHELMPDLVLLDVLMPKLDGIAVLKQIKREAAQHFVPVILVTAKSDTRDIVQGLDAGGDDYLTKPFEPAALIARVRSLLRVKELHDTIQQQAATSAAVRTTRKLEPTA